MHYEQLGEFAATLLDPRAEPIGFGCLEITRETVGVDGYDVPGVAVHRRLRPVPAAAGAVSETLREQGLPPPATAGGMTYLQARTANEVLKAQERKMRLAKRRAVACAGEGL